MKILLIIPFFIINIFSAELDLNKFEDRQEAIEDIRNLILYEEKLAIAYERFLINNYKKPTKTELESSLETLALKRIAPLDLTFTNDTFNLRLPATISSELQELYKSNKYRNRTYTYDNNINFMMEDEFAKHIFGLINYNKGEIKNCPLGDWSGTKQNCKYNNHIYFHVTKTLADNPTEYSMAYFMENFKTGPIAFDSLNLDLTSDIFKNIAIGATLYDFEGNKYIKTKYGIKVLK